MNDHLQRLENALRERGEIVVADRSPRDPGAGGVGLTVAIRYHAGHGHYVVSAERYRDDGGYGEKLSREETSFETLDRALAMVAELGFRAEQLES
jgi:hypothetical protein